MKRLTKIPEDACPTWGLEAVSWDAVITWGLYAIGTVAILAALIGIGGGLLAIWWARKMTEKQG